MTNTILLLEKIEASGYKRVYLAKMLGITTVALGNKIHNRTEFKASEILKLCEALKIENTADKEKIFFAM